MSKISSVNFGGNSVSLTVSPSEDGTLVVWRLTVITKDQNELASSGSMNFSKPVVHTSRAITTQSKSVDITSAEKDSHVNYIRSMLKAIDVAVGKENKTNLAIILLTYLSSDALPLLNSYERLKQTVISKCYEFKKQEPSGSELYKTCDTLLKALGASLTDPTTPAAPAAPAAPAKKDAKKDDKKADAKK